ncbi:MULTISPECIES: phage tail protein [unclassified Isoptericola]|uniref:phage tail protein n=1 Tax=unclassified Isoptericola TaxID=2623355 RepID=UPI003661BF8D
MATPAVEFTVVGVDKASKTFDDVGKSAADSADKISRASEEAGSKFDAAGESAGDLATWTATLGDGMATLGEQIGGPAGKFLELGGNAILAGTAIGDLGEGLVQATTWVKNLGIVQKAQAAAAWVATAAQKALNFAMKANPIGLIITGITLLVAGLVWFFTKTEIGRKIVAAAWAGIKAAIEAVGKWFTDTLVPWFSQAIEKIKGFFGGAKTWITEKWTALIEWFKAVPGRIGAAIGAVVGAIRTKFTTARDKVKDVFNGVVDWFRNIPSRVGSAVGKVASFVGEKFGSARDRVKDIFNGIVDWFKNLPSRIGTAISGVSSAITGVFKSAFNAVAGWWNRSIGAIGFTVPGWVPGVGGRSFDVPNIPMLAKGGTIRQGGWAVVGEKGPEVVDLPTGSTVYPNGTGPAGTGRNVEIKIINHFPQAEPTSVTTNKALQYAAAIGVV